MSGSFFLLGSRIWISRLHRQRASAATVRKVTRQSLLTRRASLPCPETTTAFAPDSTDAPESFLAAPDPPPQSASVSPTRAHSSPIQSSALPYQFSFAPLSHRAAHKTKSTCRVNTRARARASTAGALTFHKNMNDLERTHLSPPHIDEPNANHFAIDLRDGS